jgi:hypothetical protein
MTDEQKRMLALELALEISSILAEMARFAASKGHSNKDTTRHRGCGNYTTAQQYFHAVHCRSDAAHNLHSILSSTCCPSYSGVFSGILRQIQKDRAMERDKMPDGMAFDEDWDRVEAIARRGMAECA